jgi:N-acyl-phosphatidylethanolamine-hydrolysing phospholipase D
MIAVHHRPDGKFRNPWPDSGLPKLRDVIRVIREHVAATAGHAGASVAIERSTPTIASPRADRPDFNATWIGHSTVLLQIGGLNVLTDPVFCQRASPVQWFGPRRVTDPALALSALPPLDVVLISHNHYDHLDKAAVRQLAALNSSTTWVVPLGLAACIRRWGVRDVIELDWWQRTEVSGLAITATPTRHFSGRGLHDRNRTLWCGFALSIGGWRGFFAGDTAYHGEYSDVGARCGPFDFVMVPIGAYEPRWFMRAVHVDPEEAVRIYQDVVSAQAGSALPLMLAIHWGTFRLTHEPMDEPPRRAAARWDKVGLDAERLWIARCGETRAVGQLQLPSPVDGA